MAWQADLSDVTEIKNSAGIILERARNEFSQRIRDDDVIKGIHDIHGLIAYETYYRLLCAKKYVYGNIVSCHEYLVRRAIEQEKGVLMYISETDKFYLFSPSWIMSNGTRNERGGVPMINFNIKGGINAETGQKE